MWSGDAMTIPALTPAALHPEVPMLQRTPFRAAVVSELTKELTDLFSGLGLVPGKPSTCCTARVLSTAVEARKCMTGWTRQTVLLKGRDAATSGSRIIVTTTTTTASYLYMHQAGIRRGLPQHHHEHPPPASPLPTRRHDRT